jgi:hypothetical protein
MFRRLFAALVAFLLYGLELPGADAVTDDAGETEDRRHSRLVESRFAGPSLLKSGQPHLTSDSTAARLAPPIADSFQKYVGVITLATSPRAMTIEAALVPALSACRDRGDLKIQVIVGSCDAVPVRRTCECRGFMFSKCRQAGAVPVMEFYTDLYYRPPSGHRGLGSRRGW